MNNTMSNQTIQLYNLDSHQTEFQATVLTCEPLQAKDDTEPSHYLITLDATAFFPEGGGQPSDTGILGGVAVLDVQEKDDIIYHTLLGPLPIGEIVTGQIDWEKRFDLMQHHSGEHILSGIVHKHFGYDNVGFHMGTEFITIDFNGTLTESDIRMVELEANQAVYANIPIKAEYPSKEELDNLNYRSKKELLGSIRIVTIPGYDVCACCAPHVSLTGEVGIIKITGYQKYKGGVRVSILCGNRALKDYNKKEKSVTDISVLLSSKPYEVQNAVGNLKEENNALKGQLTQLTNQLLRYKVDMLPKDSSSILLFDNDVNTNSLRFIGNLLLERFSGICGVFTSLNDYEYKYILCSKSTDVSILGKELNVGFQGKGGGSKEMIQGSIIGNKEDIQNFISSRFRINL
jgi:alanyl-tRNA synthetase